MIDSLSNRVAKVQRELNSLKGVQFSGGGNVQAYIIDSGNTWDLNITPTSLYSATMNCIFETDNLPTSLVSWEVTILIDNVPYYLYSGGAGIGQVYFGGFSSLQGTGDVSIAKNQSQAAFIIVADVGVNIKIKVQVSSIAKGELTINVA